MDKTLYSGSANTQQEPLSIADYHRKKVVMERILGSILLIAATPVIGLIVAVVRLTSSGKGIYKQTRVGKEGREFQIFKIRTMYDKAESQGFPEWSTPGDIRITPVGRVLRFLHLDELPQLANVALGHMSLIGPRPERPEFVAKLEQCVPNYPDRLAILPGVTGLAQINLPADSSLESVRQKVILDREYIKTATMILDLRIFCCTLIRMTGLCHGVAPWLFGVECDPKEISFTRTETSDVDEMVASLDDTAINIPSLIATPLTATAAAMEATYEHDQVALSPSPVPTEIGYQDSSSSPRRPR